MYKLKALPETTKQDQNLNSEEAEDFCVVLKAWPVLHTLTHRLDSERTVGFKPLEALNGAVCEKTEERGCYVAHCTTTRSEVKKLNKNNRT